MIENFDFLSNVEKIHPEKGDLLIFYYDTDKDGFSIYPLEEISYYASKLGESMEERFGAYVLFLPNKFKLETMGTVKTLENFLESISEANN